MNLVSNYIGAISSSQFGETNAASGVDLNDTTFSDLLNKQLERKNMGDDNQNPLLNALGIPSGFQILNINGGEFTENAFEQIEAIETEIQPHTDNFASNEENQTTSSEFLTFYPSFMEKSDSISESNIFDFARKQAANYYGKYSQNVITNVEEFVEDIQSLIK